MKDERTDYKSQWAALKADPVRYAIHLEKQRQAYAKRLDREHARARAKYQKNKEYYNQKSREWYAAHPEKWKEYGIKKRREHGDRERAQDRAYYAANKEHFADRERERRNGPDREKWLKILLRSVHRSRLSAEQLEKVWEQSRNGPCEICGKVGEVMHLDHNHNTNTFRGVLCDGCNRGLGYFKENPFALIAAVKYLERNG